MQKTGGAVAKLYKALVAALVCGILVYLTLLSLFSTSFVHIGEKVYYISDTPWALLACFAALCAGLVLLRHKAPGVLAWLAHPWVKRCVLAAVGAFAVLWVCTNQPTPTADQYAVASAAANMRAGDFSDFTQGGYVEMNPHQMGIVLLLYLQSFLFGAHNYLAFRLLNVAALLVCYCMLYKINTLCGAPRQREGIVLVVSVLFLPLFAFTTYVYGILVGFALVLVGMWQALLCLRAQVRAARVRHTVFAGLALGFGIALKGNFLVVLVAVCTLLLVYAVTHRQAAAAVCAVGILLLHICVGQGVAAVGRGITGAPLSGGIPTTARLVMGIQDSPRAPGWYNDYVVSTYVVHGYDSAGTANAAAQDLRERVSELAATPFYALEFFGKKTASQWNDPTFSSLVISSSSKTGPATPWWAWNLTSGGGALWYLGYCNLFQSLVLLGALAGFTLRREKFTQVSLFLALVFLGGFLLYLVWEAKSQYTLPFFYILIPYAVEGYACLAARADALLCKLRQKQISPVRAAKTRLAAFCAVLFICVLGLSLINRRVLDVTLKPAGDVEYHAAVMQAYRNASYQDYLEEGTKEE